MAEDSFFGFSTEIPAYEDEDLATVDPSLAGLQDDIDLLNEDTFGSGAVDDHDWEQAHRKLAGLDIQSDPPQLKPSYRSVDDREQAHRKLAGLDIQSDPPQLKPSYRSVDDREQAHRKLAGLDIQSEPPQLNPSYRSVDDTNLDKEEEILEKNLARLVDEDDTEPQKPYASTGYKDIPSPSIPAVWNGSPLSSPTSSDSFHDLINPSTNIWASPTQPSRKTDDIVQGPSNTKTTPGIKPYRRPFSPAFEDDAIVSAVPKQETLLPPSSFTKKIPTNAIRLEDLEKEMSEEKIAKQFQQTPVMSNTRPSLMGRPPPGLPSPRMMQQTPQRYPQIPIQPHLPHMYHGQNSPRSGLQPFPKTPQMMHNRPMYNKMPFPAGTPPHLQRVPVARMHSDPGHLMRRGGYHNVPPPRPRFSTPQGYSMHHHSRMNNQPDNRQAYQQQRDNQHHQGTPYQPSDLERKIHSILNDEAVNREDPYAGLMTRREKEWIIKIQLLQLTSNNPDMDDFYFQTYIRRKRAKDRAKGEGVENLSTRGQPAKMTLPEFERQGREYKPLAFKDTLGKVSSSHIAHPREMVQVPHIHKDHDQEKQGSGSVVKETRHRRQMLIIIEKTFDLLLELDDIDNKQLQASPEERNNLLEKKRSTLTKLTALLKLNNEEEPSTRGDLLCHMMSHRKGKVLVSRLLQVLEKPQGEHLLGSICQNIVAVIKKDHQDEVLPLLIGPLSRVIEMTSMETALQCLKHMVYGSNEPQSPLSFVLANQFGISVLCCLLKKSTPSRMEIDKNDHSKQSWNELVSQVTKQFTDVPVKLLAKNLIGVTPLVTVLGSCASPHDMSNLHEHYRLALSTREELSS